MLERQYYSSRTGKNSKGSQLEFLELRRLFLSIYTRLEGEGYFQEDLGFMCVDSGFVPGALGANIEDELLIGVRKDNLWPVSQLIGEYGEDDLFDMIEFLFD